MYISCTGMVSVWLESKHRTPIPPKEGIRLVRERTYDDSIVDGPALVVDHHYESAHPISLASNRRTCRLKKAVTDSRTPKARLFFQPEVTLPGI